MPLAILMLIVSAAGAAIDEPDPGALLTATDDGAVASPVGDVVQALKARHNAAVTARRAAARS
jgi:hypothetical protein